MAYQVFVSYSTEDFPTVDRVRRLLTDAAVRVFVAEHSVKPGQSLQEKIGQAIRECDLFLLLWSRNSKDSEWVQQEVGAAKGLGKTILPVLLEPDLHMPAFIGGVKYVTAHQNVQEALAILKQDVFAKAASKQQQQGLAWLAIGAAVLFLLSKD